MRDQERDARPTSELWLAGDVGLIQARPRIAVVGNRTASELGVRRARKLSRQLAKAGAVVASGLARGIDTAAHVAAIKAGGRTIAVLGTPLDRCSPAANRALQEEIRRDHLLVSQFPIGRQTRPRDFADRNRTLVMLSEAVVIVEAGEQGGSVAVAWETLRQHRALFLLPSLVESREWARKALSYLGTKAVASGAEIVDAMIRAPGRQA